MPQRITPCLWFDGQAEEAARFYAGREPKAQACGWLKDKYGASWQIVPTVLLEMLAHPDQEKADLAMQAMLKMKKLDIAALQRAFAG